MVCYSDLTRKNYVKDEGTTGFKGKGFENSVQSSLKSHPLWVTINQPSGSVETLQQTLHIAQSSQSVGAIHYKL